MARKKLAIGKKSAVKRAVQGGSRKTSGETHGQVVDEKPLRPSQCRKYLRTELAGSFRGIVKGFVEQAQTGSVQHLKVTTALLDDSGTKRRRGKGSAELLLETMRRASEREAAAVVVEEDVWQE